MKQRAIALFLAWLFVAGGVEPALAAPMTATDSQTQEQMDEKEIVVNSVYEERVSKSGIRGHLKEDASEAKAAEVPEVFTTVEQAADYVRQQMTRRTQEITFRCRQKEEPPKSDTIVARATEETEASNQGDYLALSYERYHKERSLIADGEYYVAEYTLTFDYYTTAAQEEELAAQVDTILSSLDLEDKSALDTVYAIYDYVCSHVSEYDSSQGTEKLTAYYALKNGRANCQGFAALVYRLMREAGIPCRVITGKTAIGAKHAWNIVQIGDWYYNVDATWDAQQYNAGDPYLYFLRGGSDFYSHVRDEKYKKSAFKNAYPTADSMYVTNLSVGIAAMSLLPGTSYQLSVTANPTDAKRWVRWYTSNPHVAQVSVDGTIVAVSEGTAKIRAAVGSRTASCTLHVSDAASGLAISKTGATINKGKSAKITVKTIPERTHDSISWSSSNEKVATVSQTGTVKAVGAGTATITATAGSGSISCEVTVNAPVTKVNFPVSSLWITKGKSKTLNNRVWPSDCTDAVTWRVINTKIAKVSQKGKVTALKTGVTKVQVKIGTMSASYTLHVISGKVGSDYFTDIADTDKIADVINGCTEVGAFAATIGKFKPNSRMTRAQLMQALYRAAGKPKATGTLPYKDVQKSDYYYKAVLWGYRKGVIYKAESFKPSGAVTRQQLVTFLYRYAKARGVNVSTRTDITGFEDYASVADYAVTPMRWAVAKGYMTANSNRLNPKTYLTRAAASQILAAYF